MATFSSLKNLQLLENLIKSLFGQTLVIRSVNITKLKNILVYVQFVFILIFLFVSQILFLSSNLDLKLILNSRLIFFTPPAWYASIVSLLFGTPTFDIILMAIFALLFTFLTFLFAFKNISLEYSEIAYRLSNELKQIEKRSTKKTGHKKLFLNIKRYFLLNDPLQNAGYDLASIYFRRNRMMKTRIYSFLTVPISITVLLILKKQLHDPFIFFADKGLNTLFPFIIMILLINNFLEIISGSDDWKASWIFHVTPIENYSNIYWGSIKALLVKYIMPCLLLIFILFSTQMSISHAFWICFFNFFLLIAYCIYRTLSVEHLPLSKKYERGRSKKRFSTYISYLIFAFCASSEYIIFKNPIFIPLGIFILITVSVLLIKFSSQKLDEHIRMKEIFY